MVALQWHYRILQALALEEDHPEEPDDKTEPKYRQIDKVNLEPQGEEDMLIQFQRAGGYVLDWSEKLDAHNAKLFGGGSSKSTLVKRGPRDSDGADQQPSKKVKVEQGTSTNGKSEVEIAMEKATLTKVSLGTISLCGNISSL